jgi:hypothetical protein
MPVLLRVHRMRRDAPAEGPRLLRFLLIWLRAVSADADLNSYDPTPQAATDKALKRIGAILEKYPIVGS